MSNITIDMQQLIRETNKKLFTGRSNGEKAYKFFSLDQFKEGDKIIIIVPEQIVISSSYFLGMLENIMKKFNSVNEFNSAVDISNLDSKNVLEYNRAIKNGFFENSSLF